METTRREFLIGTAALAASALLPIRNDPRQSVVVLTCNKPNKNHRVYSRETILENLSRLDGKPVEGMLGMNHTSCVIHLATLSHLCHNLRLVGDDLVCDIEILDTPSGRVLKSLPPDTIAFRTAGVGGFGGQETNHLQPEDYRFWGDDFKPPRFVGGFKLVSINAIPVQDAA